MNVRRQKYRRVVDAVYTDTGVSTHNIPNLLHYATMTPGKLPKIGKYLEKRAKEGVTKKKLVPVQVSMHIFNELINACHNDLALFANNVREMMGVLLGSSQAELKELGTDTFVRFTEHGGMQFELESFVDLFIAMSTAAGTDGRSRKQMRTYGLRGLHAYISTTDDLDNFIAKHLGRDESAAAGDGPNIVDIILSNMRFDGPDEPSDLVTVAKEETTAKDWEKGSIRALATCCLKDMANRVNNITIRPLFEALLCHLDEKNLWVPNDFAIQALKALSTGLQTSLYHSIIRQLLGHLDKPHVQGSDGVKESIITCLIEVMPSNTSGPMIEVLNAMLAQLVSTTEVSDLVADGDKPNLSQTIISCVATIVRGVTDPLQRLEALNYILSSLRNVSEEPVKVKVAEAVYEVSKQLKGLPTTKTYPPSLIDRLVESTVAESPAVRILLQRSLENVMVLSGLLHRIGAVTNQGRAKSARASMLFSSPGEGHLEKIHSSLVAHVQRKNNVPESFCCVYSGWEKLLAELKEHEAVTLAPTLMALQEHFRGESSGVAVGGQQLVLALFWHLAEVTGAMEMLAYAKKIYFARKEAGALDRCTEVDEVTGALSAKKDKYSSKAKEKNMPTDEMLFGKEQMVAAMMSSERLTSAFGKTLPKMLMQTVELDDDMGLSELEGADEKGAHRASRRLLLVNQANPLAESGERVGQKQKQWTAKTFKKIFEPNDSQSDISSASTLAFSTMATTLATQEAKDRAVMLDALSFLDEDFGEGEVAGEGQEGEGELSDRSVKSILDIRFPTFALE